MSSSVSGALRIVAGMTVVVALMVAGYLGRSPWIVVLATPALTLLYALGKFRQWQMAWRAGGSKSIGLGVLATLPVQLGLGCVFYLMGRGLASLVAPAPIVAFGTGDVLGVGLVFLIGLACSLAIIKLEGRAMGLRDARTAPVVDQTVSPTEEVELDMDPRPLTPETFFQSPGYWRPDPLREALEGRGKRVAKPALAASDAEIATAEERIGFRLPESLRALYRMLDGGYVGTLYVPLKTDPGPVYDDWRGAFSIDYSSLSPLTGLRTVRAHYEDFTDDPDDMPTHADKLLVLQARYGDMTLLDYSRPGEPQVSIVDFDRNGDLADISFESFDDFFLALRRPKEEKPRSFHRELFRSKPLGALPRDSRATAFWGDGNHPFVNMAKGRDDGWEPQAMADETLIEQTEARIGAKLPGLIKELWRARNGGDVAYRFLEDGPDNELQPFEELAPLEYAVTLAELSRRIDFAPGETPWHASIAEADKLVVLNAKRDALVLLDFRRQGDPSLLVADNFGASGLDHARVFEDIHAFIEKLRKFERPPLLPSPR
ncbi:SMI1/KNR4 family protein [Variovorax sp. RB2P76]|uniref:SMI1/KNR4 family protein n=1 Tax=Variovorax sp. RB2P76 TaxID=3443736 RepID=UPI003F451CA1